MGLFNFRKKEKKTKFRITEPDKGWVIENFRWLIQIYGCPRLEHKPIVFSDEFFPLSTSGEGEIVGNLIDDLKSILSLEQVHVTFEFQEDIRDIEGLPYEIEGKSFQSELIVAEAQYHIVLAKNLLKHDNALLSSLIYEFVKISLTHDSREYDTGEDTDLFVYMAGVYYGFGPLLYQSLVVRGRSSDGFWDTHWSFVADLPQEVMVYALALYLNLRGDKDLGWKNDLSNELESLLDDAIYYQKQYPVDLVPKGEVEAEALYATGLKQFDVFDWRSAIETFRKAIFLETSNPLKADIYTSLGYCQVRMGDLYNSITSFDEARILNANEYMLSNMAYAMILIGQLDAAKELTEVALEFDVLLGYAHRNKAIYHQMTGNSTLAEKHFQKAIAVGEPVDLLEFHYSEFLFEERKEEEAVIYLKKAVEKGEPEAIAKYQSLGF